MIASHRTRTLLLLAALALGASGCRAPLQHQEPGHEPSGDPSLVSKGPADAPVVIEEFSDFECPFCRRGAATMDDLMALYPGKIRLVFRHFPLRFHHHAHAAAIASLAAHAQGAFWAYHDRLFFDSGPLSKDELVRQAEELGLDMERFRRDLDDPALAETVARDLERGQEVGVRGVPHFLVNGRPLPGAQPIQAFRLMVEEELGKAEALAQEGEPAARISRILTERNLEAR